MKKLFAIMGLISAFAIGAPRAHAAPPPAPAKGACCAAPGAVPVNTGAVINPGAVIYPGVAVSPGAVINTGAAIKPDATFSIEGMSCAACAEKIGQEVSKVENVEMAGADLRTGELLVVAKKDKKVSMKAVWESVVKAGYKPTKFITGEGVFKEMPKD